MKQFIENKDETGNGAYSWAFLTEVRTACIFAAPRAMFLPYPSVDAEER